MRASFKPVSPKSVRGERDLCAVLLPLSRENKHKDWIDIGSFPLYTLRERHLCAEWSSPLNPGITGIMSGKPPETPVNPLCNEASALKRLKGGSGPCGHLSDIKLIMCGEHRGFTGFSPVSHCFERFIPGFPPPFPLRNLFKSPIKPQLLVKTGRKTLEWSTNLRHPSE